MFNNESKMIQEIEVSILMAITSVRQTITKTINLSRFEQKDIPPF